MEESEFQIIADATMSDLENWLLEQDKEGRLEIESASGVITIEFPSGKQLVISKHTASRQIWLASPALGGLHFRRVGDGWALPDGRTLQGVVESAIKDL